MSSRSQAIYNKATLQGLMRAIKFDVSGVDMDLSKKFEVLIAIHWSWFVVDFCIQIIMEESKNVFDLCLSETDEPLELEEFLEEHPDVDVNLFQHVNGARSIHAAAYRGHGACLRLLIKANADLEMRDNAGFTAVQLASSNGNLNCLQILIESKADVNAASMLPMTEA
jgi:hypothetical protein